MKHAKLLALLLAGVSGSVPHRLRQYGRQLFLCARKQCTGKQRAVPGGFHAR